MTLQLENMNMDDKELLLYEEHHIFQETPWTVHLKSESLHW